MLKLQVTVGSSYDPSTHRTILPNDDSNPFFIDTEYFIGRICVRIRDFQGITPSEKNILSSSPYFEGNNYQYSIQIQGKFKGNKWTADDILFGNDFDRKINLPSVSWLGLKILKWIDPGLESDIYSDKPWAFSPLIFTTNSVHLINNNNNEQNNYNELLPSWPSSNGEHIMDNSIYDPIFGSLISNDSTSRKLYFSSKENRMNFKINENQVWNFDFFNSYIDFNKITVKLPGLFEIGVLQYWDGQPFRYVCKARDSSAVFFVVIFQLVEVKDEINEKNSIQNKENLIPEGIKSENNIISTPIFLKDQQKYSGVLTPNSISRWSSVKSPSSKNHLTPFRYAIASPSPLALASDDYFNEGTSDDDDFDFDCKLVD